MRNYDNLPWTHIGNVHVDAGLMYLGDPCYVLGDDASDRVTDWHAFCDMLDKHAYPTAMIYKKGTGAICSTGFGDGTYPVYVKFSDEGSWGKRVAEMKIVFIGADDEELEDEDEDAG
jgi:hypothetical protein